MTTHIPLQPLYSLPCQQFKRITVVAKDPAGHLKKIWFDGEDNFNESFCTCCLLIPGMNEFELAGTLKVGFQRPFSDVQGTPLLSIAVFDKADNKMDLFVTPDGHVDLYQWNPESKAYQKKPSDLSITFLKSELSDRPADQLMDSELQPVWLARCENHQELLLAHPPTSNELEPFIWNRYREQFERITCTCPHVVKLKSEKINDNLNVLMTVKRGETEWVRVVVENNKLYKLVITEDEQAAPTYLKSAIVRDLRGFELEAIRNIRYFDYVAYEFDAKYNPKLDNSWVLYPGFEKNNRKMTIIDGTGQLSEVYQPESLRIYPRALEAKILKKCEEHHESYKLSRRRPMEPQYLEYWRAIFKKNKVTTSKKSSRTSSGASQRTSDVFQNQNLSISARTNEIQEAPPPVFRGVPDHRVPSTSSGVWYEEDLITDSESKNKTSTWKDFGGEAGVEKFSKLTIRAARKEKSTDANTDKTLEFALADNGII